MKKKLLTLLFFVSACLSSMAFTIDDLCGVYAEKTSGQQALSFLCETYNSVSFSNLVVVSKNEAGELEFYGFYKSPYALKGVFNEADQTITFSKQNVWGSESYVICKNSDVTATIAENGKITFAGYVVSFGSDDYCKDMSTTFTKQTEQFYAEGTISAPGYFEGGATLRFYGSNRYLLTEDTDMHYTHYLSVNATTGVITFPWATVMYSDDPYCFIYNVLEDEDLLMVGNKSAESKFTKTSSEVTLQTPFQYYVDYSDQLKDNPTPDAEGTYSGTFTITSGIDDIKATTQSSKVYNLAGQQLRSVQPGINVIGTRKVMVR